MLLILVCLVFRMIMKIEPQIFVFFLESLDSHHSEITGREIFLEAYSEWQDSKAVLESLKVLELRGRYNLMRG